MTVHDRDNNHLTTNSDMTAQERKREAIVAAAADLFLDSGYSGVTLDAVISRVGGSKRTLYAYFGDKDGLFAAIVNRLCEEIVTPLTRLVLVGRPLREALGATAQTFFDVLLAPRTLALHRLVVAEATRAPEAARTFFLAAPTTSYRCLAEYFKWASEVGIVTPGDPQQRSRIFLDALTADFQLRCLLGLLDSPTQMERDERMNETIAIFMKGIAAS
ncbi:MAG TPA: TetR/AcrR family transcriptional regulator [Rhodocyclaceae bacterium]|uniref:TetR/AcrR family transcriptional regulator n=1 Tax=Thauera sp. TaxID=1905334 RepID=UPI002C03DF6F|nr:TetR/AcrR family transcriptional regulator [Thauera sp.]HRP23944.1 TetR/AcrR family transcriptional regulator [Thauera sp.]HRQ48044.1 TetR/AcrR family transcriptional regulator [Rhodocyclaceae bacterium]